MYVLCSVLAQAHCDNADQSEMTCPLASTFMSFVHLCMQSFACTLTKHPLHPRRTLPQTGRCHRWRFPSAQPRLSPLLLEVTERHRETVTRHILTTTSVLSHFARLNPRRNKKPGNNHAPSHNAVVTVRIQPRTTQVHLHSLISSRNPAEAASFILAPLSPFFFPPPLLLLARIPPFIPNIPRDLSLDSLFYFFRRFSCITSATNLGCTGVSLMAA